LYSAFLRKAPQMRSDMDHTSRPSVQHTHRHTDHATCEICSNRPHLYSACERCGLKVLRRHPSLMRPDSSKDLGVI